MISDCPCQITGPAPKLLSVSMIENRCSEWQGVGEGLNKTGDFKDKRCGIFRYIKTSFHARRVFDTLNILDTN